MYHAELKGKLSFSQERGEDILTSNVFSFFEYASRTVYLKELLALLGISPTDQELNRADFIFWPAYDDRTEPDLVILVGRYYLLFEAKYLSGFGIDQLERELDGGRAEARTLRKELVLVALTAHSTRPPDIFSGLPADCQHMLRWMNWQSISRMLQEILEREDPTVADQLFAQDLYSLLDRRNLRGFHSFGRLANRTVGARAGRIFFDARTATYRGQFLGFHDSLAQLPLVHMHTGNLFYTHVYFQNLPQVQAHEVGPKFLRRGDQ